MIQRFSSAFESPPAAKNYAHIPLSLADPSRAEQLLRLSLRDNCERTDRLFAVLMGFQWLAGILAALVLSPRTWAGASSQVHIHVWAAVFLGGLIAALPIGLAMMLPGEKITRYTIAVAQMLFSALLIHLTGGRIETHFHVFGSLAFLAAYRDFRVLILGSAIVGIDHALRGVFWPRSVFGTDVTSQWRWLEHVGWVVFEDLFLLLVMRQSLREMAVAATRQAAIEASHDAIGAADRAKGEFLANMSHEIRTPLTAILGYNELMRSPGQTPQDRADCVQTVHRNGQHLLLILNDLLDFSKIEAGQMQLEEIPTRTQEVVAEVVSLLRPRAIERGLTLCTEFATAVPETMLTDPTRLKQILSNLLSNAIKFTQSGSVTIIVSHEHSTIRFTVADTGIGLTTEQLERLFKPFTQADASTSRKFGGTGLGLSICKGLSELMQGSISVESTPNVGSRFTLSMPARMPSDTRMIQPEHETLRPPAAASGRVEGPVTPEASDIPGLETQQRENLLSGIRSADGSHPEPGPEQRPEQRDAKRWGRVLLADDAADNLRLLRKLLEREGLEVVAVETGSAAVEAARASMDSPAGGFDVVLMDMQMPELDGYSATSTLRSLGYSRPIVALTAHASERDRERCLAAGCDDYLSKPFNLTQLLTCVHSAIPGAAGKLGPTPKQQV